MNRYLFSLLMLMWLQPVQAEMPKMIIIITHDRIKTTNLDAVRSMGITAHSMNIHGPRNLRDFLNPVNATSQEEGEAIILERSKSITEEDKMSFFRPSMIIRELNIKKLPVAVFDKGDKIIYGVTDFIQALKIWEQSQ